MWLAILGPLLVHDGETPVDVPQGRLRVLLAALLLHAGDPVATDALAQIVWDGSPPSGAAVTLRSHVARLRRVLGPRAGPRPVTRYPGYLLQAGEDEVDALRFRRLCRDGGAALREGAWARADRLLGEALDLWRGVPLADVTCESLRRDEGQELEELRLQAEEWRADAALNLGRHAELVPGVQSLAARHPLRERFHGQLMLALYRCGRQAEALAAYQRARDVLVTELGVEPEPALRDLHQRILSADPALAGTERPAGAEPQRAVPRELPPAVPGFTGRSAELAALTRLLDQSSEQPPGAIVISAIGGTAGVGKTALAVRWAHQVAGRFPDGQLYVNLRGFDSSRTPVTPAAAIRGFLDAIGVPLAEIPPLPEGQAALYRRLLADRKMLIVLDNAHDEQQVRPLLPASPGSLVLVTSRSELSGLAATDGARLLILNVLPHDEAAELLTGRIGHAQAAAEPEVVGEIASLCACLPLALAVAAARAAARPSFPLAALAAELRDSTDRMDALDTEDPSASVRAVFSWSYRQLGSVAARMFRLLGLSPGLDISVPAAASLAGTSEPAARRLLSELASKCLIAERVPGRYAFHDLLRAYAASLARDCDSQAECHAAIGRVLDHYLHTAAHSAFTLDSGREQILLIPPRAGSTPKQPADRRSALAWFDAEHQVLLAAVSLAVESGFDGHAWQLPWAMTAYLRAHGNYQEWAACQRTALVAAARLGDIHGQAVSGRQLAGALTHLDDYDQARFHLRHSLELYRQVGDRLGEAKVHDTLGHLAGRQDHYAEALHHAEQALLLYQAAGDRGGEAAALNNIGWCHNLLGDYEQARVFCRRALSLSEEVGYRWIEGHCWDSLGYAEHHLGNFSEAGTCYECALRICREIGERHSEAEALTHLGDARHAAGDPPKAREAWQQALAILEDLQHREADKVRAKLDEMES
jgi:DNA-binding SARP family transcriptional activator